MSQVQAGSGLWMIGAVVVVVGGLFYFTGNNADPASAAPVATNAAGTGPTITVYKTPT